MVTGFLYYGSVVQLVRTLACHARGRGFKSHSSRHKSKLKKVRTKGIGITLPKTLCLHKDSFSGVWSIHVSTLPLSYIDNIRLGSSDG